MVASAVSGAREQILAGIRAALTDVPGDEPASYEAPTAPAAVASLDLLATRIADYRARVTRVVGGATEIASAVTEACARHGVRRLIAPHDLPGDWRPAGVDIVPDDPAAPLSTAELDAADGVLTACALAIAETGTIVLDAGPGQGRRAATLLPDLHVCVVLGPQVVDDVPAAMLALEATVRETGRPLTFVSGPSATSDIELERVEGVHGPRRLEIVLVDQRVRMSVERCDDHVTSTNRRDFGPACD